MFNRLLLQHLKGYWKQTLITPVLVIIDTVCELIIVFLMSDIIDIGILQQDTDFVLHTGVIMLGLSVISATCGTLGVYFAAHAAQGYGANLRSASFRKMMALSFSDIDRFSSGTLITRITSDINNVQVAFVITIRMMIRIPVMVAVSLIMTFSISARLTLILLLVLPPLFLLLKHLVFRSAALFQNVQQQLDKLSSLVQQNLIGIRVIRAFHRIRQEQNRFAVSNDNLTNSSIKAVACSFLIRPVITVSLSFVTAAVILSGSKMTLNGTLPLGDLYTFLTFLTIIITNLSSIASMLTNTVRANASSVRIRELLTVETEEPSSSVSVSSTESGVILRDVTFRYGTSAPVLQHVSISIAKGSFAALIGATGSGKSTIASLLCGFYAPEQGEILLNGHPVRALPPEEQKKRIAIVQQECTLFSGTLRENLLWGRSSANDEELWDALRTAQATEFVMSLPDELNARVGQGGINFSGGQRQRLCIARALVAKPELLILDDASSALDAHTEQALFESLPKYCADMSVLVITHRISALPNHWNVILLDNGTVLESGTHQQLMALKGAYHNLYTMQENGGAE